MTCNEFERVLIELEGRSLEQHEHLRFCSHCSAMVAELREISQQARLLVEDEDPSSRVWNRLEIALRQEGLIREPQSSPVRVVRRAHPWLMPMAASFLVLFTLLIYERGGVQRQPLPASPALTASLQSDAIPVEQAELLKAVEAREPAMGAAYEADFRAVNAYVRDAELSARSNPNDEISQQYLTNAYEQRAMLYEMAMDRSLP